MNTHTYLFILTLFVCWSTSFSHEYHHHLKDGSRVSYVYWRNATKRAIASVVPRPKIINYINHIDYLEVKPKELQFRNLLPSKCLTVNLGLNRYRENNYFFDDVGPEAKDDPIRYQRKRLGQLSAVELVGTKDFVCEVIPYPDMNESYNLTVKYDEKSQNNKIVVTAKSTWGFIRAFETLSQLIFNIRPDVKDETDSSGIYAINLVNIYDEPRFKHRGFMLDTARHYIPVDRILELLDAMSFDKLNVFHWHIVDDQSFPMESIAYPNLSRSTFRPSMSYTQLEVHMIVFYAAVRGIRVIPELDTPGHSYALRHIPNLLTECYDIKTKKKNGDFGPIDPTKESAYATIDTLLTEFQSLFGDPYFFAGGDEVDFDCWKSNPDLNNWMMTKNMSGNYTELTNVYIRRLYNIIRNHGKKMIVWQEVFDMGANLPRDVVISVWKYINDKPAFMAQIANVVKEGYQAILSSCWYLNYIDYGQDWIKFYNCDPTSEPVQKDHEHLVLGGEICMWTEFVDATNVVSRTWPRASAAAERLWSPKNVNDSKEFLHRLEQHRCRLLRRGVQAEPVNGPGYC